MDREQGLSSGAVAAASIMWTKGFVGAAVPTGMSRKADQPRNETEEILQLREKRQSNWTVKKKPTKVIYHVEKLHLGELWGL